MGEIVGAALVAHVPTIVMSEPDRRELNDGKEISLVPGLHRLREEVIAPAAPDTIVVLDSHWFTTVEFVVTSHERRSGHFTSDELPRGMSGVPYDIHGDPALARAIAAEGAATDECWITALDDPHLPIHYATVNLLGFLQGDERWVTMSTCQTAETVDFLTVGACIQRAIADSDRRVFLLASGAMSHEFHPLRQLRAHEASDPAHIRRPEARAADQRILDAWARGDHASVLEFMPEFLAFHPEGRFGHYLMLVAALGGAECRAVGTPYSDYENSIGTAQIHVNFERPAAGWTAA